MTLIHHNFYSEEVCSKFHEMNEAVGFGTMFPESVHDHFNKTVHFSDSAQVQLYYVAYSGALRKLQSLSNMYMHIMNRKPHAYRLEYDVEDEAPLCASQFNEIPRQQVKDYVSLLEGEHETEFALIQVGMFIDEKFQPTMNVNNANQQPQPKELQYLMKGENLAKRYWDYCFQHIKNGWTVDDVIDALAMPDHEIQPEPIDNLESWLLRNIKGYQPR